MDSMEILIKEQYQIFNRLKKLQEKCKQNPSIKEGDISTRIASLSSYWEKFCKYHEKIEKIRMKNKTDITNESYFKDDLYFQCEWLYIEMKGELLEDQSSNVSVSGELQIQDKKNELEILETKLNVPKFSGEFTNWLEFQREYNSLVHTNSDLNNSQKFEYLKSVLPNEEFNLIRHFDIPGDETGYENAWKILQEKYSETKLIELYISKLLKQPSVRDLSRSRDLLQTTKECLRHQEVLKIDTNNWDVLLIHILCNKFHEKPTIEWGEDGPKLQDFFKFLESKIQTNFESEHSKTIKEKRKVFPCICCNGIHVLWNCDNFKRMSIGERMNLVERKSSCTRCLQSHHHASRCLSSSSCSHCKGEHNYLLCERDGEKNHLKRTATRGDEGSSSNDRDYETRGGIKKKYVDTHPLPSN